MKILDQTHQADYDANFLGHNALAQFSLNTAQTVLRHGCHYSLLVAKKCFG